MVLGTLDHYLEEKIPVIFLSPVEKYANFIEVQADEEMLNDFFLFPSRELIF